VKSVSFISESSKLVFFKFTQKNDDKLILQSLKLKFDKKGLRSTNFNHIILQLTNSKLLNVVSFKDIFDRLHFSILQSVKFLHEKLNHEKSIQ
jgi:hypothetical protein